MKFRFVLLPFAVFLVSAFLLWLIVYEGYAEKLTLSIISKNLAKNGISFSAQNFSGNIRQGITIEKPILRKGKTEIKAERIYIRSRRTPILWGTFWIKELRIEGVEAKIELSQNSREQEKIKIPLWLTIFAKNVSIEIKRAEIIYNNGESRVFENCLFETNFSYILHKFDFSRLSATIEKSPFKNKIAFEGKGDAKLSKYINLDGQIKFGECYGDIGIKFERKEKERSFQCRFKNFCLNLKDLRNFADFPELVIHCDAEVALSKNNLRIKGEFDEHTYGRFSINCVGKIEENVLSGDVCISSSPFYYSLSISDINSDKLKINSDLKGSFSYDFLTKKIFAKLSGKLRESEALGIAVSAGSADLTIDNSALNVFSNFSSPSAGKGDVEIDYNFHTYKADIRFRTEETYPKKVLETLGIDVPMPEPLKFSSAKFKCHLAEILFEENTIVISIDAKDEKGGDYSVVLHFEDSQLNTLDILAKTIAPNQWGLDAPFVFSGKMFFNFKESKKYIPFDLSEALFHFEKFDIGPVNSKIKILDSKTLILPKTQVDFTFGKAEIEGELKENGSYKGMASLSRIDLDKIDKSLGDGSIKGNCEFNGDFSSINISGNFLSERLKIKGSDLYQVNLKGDGNYKNGKIDFAVSVDSAYLSAFGRNFSDIKATLKKNGNGGIFDISLNLDENNDTSAKGVFALDEKNNISFFFDSLIFNMDKRRLYLTQKAEVDIKENSFAVKNLQLESGNSKLNFSGNFETGKEDGAIEGKLVLENFSALLIPLLNLPNTASGRIDCDLKIGGSFANPQFFGEAILKNFTYQLPESDLKLVGLLKADFEKNKITFSNAYLTTTEEGDLRLSGAIEFSKRTPSFDLKLSAEDFPVAYKNLFSGVLDAEISLSGGLSEPKIEGTVNILKGRIQLKQSFSQDLPESVVFVGQVLPKSETSFFKDILPKIRGGVKINSRKKLWLLRKDLIANLSGSVLVNFTNDGIQPEGKMTIEEGRFLLSGSKFDLKDSSFYFSSGKELLPLIDISAEKEVSGYEVKIRLQGNAEKPTLTLSSTPPLEQGEILSLILFGRTSQKLNPEESARWGGAAAALAFSYEASPILNSVSKKMKIDTMEIGTSSKGDPQIGFSKYLSDRLVLEYQQTFGALPESNVNLRYRINQNLSVETNSSTQGHSGADLIWERKY